MTKQRVTRKPDPVKPDTKSAVKMGLPEIADGLEQLSAEWRNYYQRIPETLALGLVGRIAASLLPEDQAKALA